MTSKRDKPPKLSLVKSHEPAVPPAPARDEPPQLDKPRKLAPSCPSWFSDEQRDEFKEICRRLEDISCLSRAHVGDIRALAIAQDKLRQTTEFINENGGGYFNIIKTARPYRCPACKGEGIQPSKLREQQPAAKSKRQRGQRGKPSRAALAGPPCRFCGGKGAIAGKDHKDRVKCPEVTDQRHAIEQVMLLSAKLGLDVMSHNKLFGRQAGTGRVKSPLAELMSRRATRK